MRQDGDNPESFRSNIKYLLRAVSLRGFLRKRPWLLLGEIFVDDCD